MRVYYDFHIHSALSPCADNDMTPQSICGMACVKELGAIAVADHNAIANVQAVVECGTAFGITVVPAIEVQTAEDIHILCLFATVEELTSFFMKLDFLPYENREDIFGEQLIINSDDEVTGKERRMLLASAVQDCYAVVKMANACGGCAVAAHIDRESNGMVAILGEVPPDLELAAVEFSTHASEELKQQYQSYFRLTDSDAHHLEDIAESNSIEAEENSAAEIVRLLRAHIKKREDW